MVRARRRAGADSTTEASFEARRRVQVVILAGHASVGEAVRAALAVRGFPATVRPRGFDEDQFDGRAFASTGATPGRLVVGLLLAHASDEHAVVAQAILGHVTIPWLVLSPGERGPIWGAYYAAGAALVVPPGVTLEEVCELILDLAGGGSLGVARDRRALIRAWQQMVRERQELNDRLSLLTAREYQVLEQLCDGRAVRSIAEVFEVAETTVRSQVKGILKKLGVSSQIAAVVAYAQVRGGAVGRDAPGARGAAGAASSPRPQLTFPNFGE